MTRFQQESNYMYPAIRICGTCRHFGRYAEQTSNDDECRELTCIADPDSSNVSVCGVCDKWEPDTCDHVQEEGVA